MTIGLKHLCLFWVAALFIVAGGQLAHAYEELCCTHEHVSHDHEEPAGTKECPTGHECCHSHLSSAVDLTKPMVLPGVTFVSVSTFLTDDASFEGHREKIEYPPRLS